MKVKESDEGNFMPLSSAHVAYIKLKIMCRTIGNVMKPSEYYVKYSAQ